MPNVIGVSVRDFGALGDGIADDRPAIQSALDGGASRVVIPYGKYMLAQGLIIRSHTKLLLHPLAELRLADGAGRSMNDYLLTNSEHEFGNKSITIEGGIWDGNNPGNHRGPDEPGSYSGVMMNFVNVEGLHIRQMTLVDAESYFIRLGKVSDFWIEDLAFEIRNLRPNQDGVHISGYCQDGIIRNLRGLGSRTPNDDMVALVADDALQRAQNLNGAFNGPIRRIRVEQLRAISCHSFLRLLSVDHVIEDVEIHDVEGGCRCCAINMDACRECRVTLFEEDDRPDGVGSIGNVRVSDLHVFKAADTNRQPLIDFRTRADRFSVTRFSRDTERDVSPGSPTLCIEKSGPLEMTLDGVTDPPPDEEIRLLKAPSGEADSFRVQRELSHHDRFVLGAGDFEKLEISRRTSLES